MACCGGPNSLEHNGFLLKGTMVPGDAELNVQEYDRLPTREGYLKKMSRKRRFQKRYFVLKNGYLLYYVSNKKTTVLGAIDLVHVTRVTPSSLEDCFELQFENGDIYTLCAYSSVQQGEWQSDVGQWLRAKRLLSTTRGKMHQAKSSRSLKPPAGAPEGSKGTKGGAAPPAPSPPQPSPDAEKPAGGTGLRDDQGSKAKDKARKPPSSPSSPKPAHVVWSVPSPTPVPPQKSKDKDRHKDRHKAEQKPAAATETPDKHKRKGHKYQTPPSVKPPAASPTRPPNIQTPTISSPIASPSSAETPRFADQMPSKEGDMYMYMKMQNWKKRTWRAEKGLLRFFRKHREIHTIRMRDIRRLEEKTAVGQVPAFVMDIRERASGQTVSLLCRGETPRITYEWFFYLDKIVQNVGRRSSFSTVSTMQTTPRVRGQTHSPIAEEFPSIESDDSTGVVLPEWLDKLTKMDTSEKEIWIQDHLNSMEKGAKAKAYKEKDQETSPHSWIPPYLHALCSALRELSDACRMYNELVILRMIVRSCVLSVTLVLNIIDSPNCRLDLDEMIEALGSISAFKLAKEDALRGIPLVSARDPTLSPEQQQVALHQELPDLEESYYVTALVDKAILELQPRLTDITEKVTDKLEYQNWKQIGIKRGDGTLGTKSPHRFFYLMTNLLPWISHPGEHGSPVFLVQSFELVLFQVVQYVSNVLGKMRTVVPQLRARPEFKTEGFPAQFQLFLHAIINDISIFLDKTEEIGDRVMKALEQNKESYLALEASARDDGEESKQQDDIPAVQEIDRALAAIKEALQRANKSALQTANQLIVVFVNDVIFSEFDISPVFSSEWAKRALEPPKPGKPRKHGFVKIAADTIRDFLEEYKPWADPWFFERVASMSLQNVSTRYLQRFLEAVHFPERGILSGKKLRFTRENRYTEVLSEDISSLEEMFMALLQRETTVFGLSPLRDLRDLLEADGDDIIATFERTVRTNTPVALEAFIVLEAVVQARPVFKDKKTANAIKRNGAKLVKEFGLKKTFIPEPSVFKPYGENLNFRVYQSAVSSIQPCKQRLNDIDTLFDDVPQSELVKRMRMLNLDTSGFTSDIPFSEIRKMFKAGVTGADEIRTAREDAEAREREEMQRMHEAIRKGAIDEADSFIFGDTAVPNQAPHEEEEAKATPQRATPQRPRQAQQPQEETPPKPPASETPPPASGGNGNPFATEDEKDPFAFDYMQLFAV